MFDKFGEFDSAEEINKKAAELLAAGDTEGVRALAEENGLDPEDADDYVNGDIPELTNTLLAAYGKLNMEDGKLQLDEIMADWLSYIRMECAENPEMAAAVRRIGRSLECCIAALLKWSFEHHKPVDKEIIKAAGVNAGRVTMGIPGIGTAKKIIREYYLGGRA